MNTDQTCSATPALRSFGLEEHIQRSSLISVSIHFHLWLKDPGFRTDLGQFFSLKGSDHR